MESPPPPPSRRDRQGDAPEGTLLPIPDPAESARLLAGAGAAAVSAPPGFRSGFVALIGRPNVGKSTLLNQLVGSKVAITSPVAQTTRNRLRAILTTAGAQLVLLDTPGIHKPHHLLGQRLVQSARNAIGEVDLVLLLVDGSQPAGRGDAFIVELLRRSGMPVLVALNKWDQVDPAQAEALLSSYRELLQVPVETLPEAERSAGGSRESARDPGSEPAGSRAEAPDGSGARADAPASEGQASPWAGATSASTSLPWPLFPVSALSGEGTETLVAALSAALPPGPYLYPPEAISDQPEQLLLAELIREQVLQHTREEVPHSVAVMIERIVDDGPRTAVLATVLVERSSQKGILIGKGGSMLRTIGQGARLQMQKLIDGPVYLELFVKVVPGWRSHPGRLAELGYRGD